MGDNPVRIRQRHRSADEWRELVAAWKQSGKTRDVWCREQGVGRESLRRWTKRLRRTEANTPLVQIGKDVSAAAQVPMQLRVLANGDVELVGAFSEEVLRRVLRLAREAAHVS